MTPMMAPQQMQDVPPQTPHRYGMGAPMSPGYPQGPMSPGGQGGPMSPNGYQNDRAAPPQCLTSVKPADQMNHEEAARWIGSIGRLKGWVEANSYERNCMRHEISGFMLSQLTMEDLDKVLGVKKFGHRLEIWCSIRQIFPYLLPFTRGNTGQPDDGRVDDGRSDQSKLSGQTGGSSKYALTPLKTSKKPKYLSVPLNDRVQRQKLDQG